MNIAESSTTLNLKSFLLLLRVLVIGIANVPADELLIDSIGVLRKFAVGIESGEQFKWKL